MLAGYVGLGAVLSQQQEDGSIYPIAYASRSLDPHERNYGVTKLETLGLVWAVRCFRPYLLGHRTVVYTDHSACLSLLNHPRPSGKLVRWAMTIQEMDLIIKHRSGKSNTNADALSCNPVHLNPTDTNVNSCKAVTVVELSSSEGGLPASAQPHESLSKPSLLLCASLVAVLATSPRRASLSQQNASVVVVVMVTNLLVPCPVN